MAQLDYYQIYQTFLLHEVQWCTQKAGSVHVCIRISKTVILKRQCNKWYKYCRDLDNKNITKIEMKTFGSVTYENICNAFQIAFCVWLQSQ